MHIQTYHNESEGKKRVWRIEVIWEKFNYLTPAVSGETDAHGLISTSTVDSLSLSLSLSLYWQCSRCVVYVCAASRDVNIKTTSVMSRARWAATTGARKSRLPHLKNTHTLTYITEILPLLQQCILQTQSLWILSRRGFLILKPVLRFLRKKLLVHIDNL